MDHSEPSAPNKTNLIVRTAVGLMIAGALVYGGFWFAESSRLSDRVNELVADTRAQVYRPLLEGPATFHDWLDAAPERWQPLIDSTEDLKGTRAEDAHLLTIAMRDAVVDFMLEMTAYEIRTYQVIGLMNSHPDSTLGETPAYATSTVGVIDSHTPGGFIEIPSDVAADMVANMFGIERTPPIEGDRYEWDNDVALFHTIAEGHGPALLERIAELSEEALTKADTAREMANSVHVQIAQSSLPEGQRVRMLSDWNEFAYAISGMTEPYEQERERFLLEYSKYVEYLITEFDPDELRPERLHQMDYNRQMDIIELRSNIRVSW